METTNPSPTVYSVTNDIVYKLDQTLETSSGKATLANLRNSIGKPLSQSVEIWPLLFENLPGDFLSQDQSESRKELAILTTLQLYALYRQGKQIPVRKQNEKRGFENIGYSLSTLRTGDNTVSVDRRFNTLITAATYDELIHHLRQMIKLLKSKMSGEINIDFGRLAQDLYGFLIEKEENIRLNWARAYYRTNPKGGIENDQ
ncbi:MAG: type I-E CRISPR-associated protein Cse2/CasB [Saccharofermentanales bacterium]